MSKIVITAFEPFGVVGASIRRTNASKQILHNISSQNPSDCIFQILPVNNQAEVILRNLCEKEKPDAVLCLGEDLLLLPNKVNLEPYAHNVQATALPFVGLLSHDTVKSDFAAKQGAQDSHSTIKGYFCNRVYLAALKWAQENGNAPTAFLHIAVAGRRDQQTKKVIGILDALRSEIQTATPKTYRPDLASSSLDKMIPY